MKDKDTNIAISVVTFKNSGKYNTAPFIFIIPWIKSL
jgi:hypothetical protein